MQTLRKKTAVLEARGKWAKEWNKITQKKQKECEKEQANSSKKEKKPYCKIYGSELGNNTRLLKGTH